MPLPSQEKFFEKYNISKEDFTKVDLNWDILVKIYEDYINLIENLELTAQSVVNKLNKALKVHSVRYRIKDSEHLIEKIIRKKIERNDLNITLGNYQEGITDMIGIRVLHLFKEDWEIIHNYVVKEFNLIGNTIAYVREGDKSEYLECFRKNNCEIKTHPFGYRSVHYLFESSLFKRKLIIELQVRTIFEEGWSEVDHEIKYPYVKGNIILERFLDILNRFAGSADEMCSFIKYLQPELKKQEEKIDSLEDQIDRLKIDSSEKIQIKKNIRGLDSMFSNISGLTVTASSLLNPQAMDMVATASTNTASLAGDFFKDRGFVGTANSIKSASATIDNSFLDNHKIPSITESESIALSSYNIPDIGDAGYAINPDNKSNKL